MVNQSNMIIGGSNSETPSKFQNSESYFPRKCITTKSKESKAAKTVANISNFLLRKSTHSFTTF